MRGVIRVEAPEALDITLTVTATLAEWRQIKEQLDDSRSGSVPDVLGRQVLDLIKRAETALAQGSWTTGYATGAAEEETK